MGCFGKIKKNSIFCECLSILDILRKWLLRLFEKQNKLISPKFLSSYQGPRTFRSPYCISHEDFNVNNLDKIFISKHKIMASGVAR